MASPVVQQSPTAVRPAAPVNDAVLPTSSRNNRTIRGSLRQIWRASFGLVERVPGVSACFGRRRQRESPAGMGNVGDAPRMADVVAALNMEGVGEVPLVDDVGDGPVMEDIRNAPLRPLALARRDGEDPPALDLSFVSADQENNEPDNQREVTMAALMPVLEKISDSFADGQYIDALLVVKMQTLTSDFKVASKKQEQKNLELTQMISAQAQELMDKEKVIDVLVETVDYQAGQIKAMQQKIDTLEQQNKDLGQQCENLEQDVRDLKKDLGQHCKNLEQDVRDLKKENKESKETISDLQKQITSLKEIVDVMNKAGGKDK